MTTDTDHKKIVPVAGNPALVKKDSTVAPLWAKYEIRLLEKSQAHSPDESAKSLAKWLYGIIGSSGLEPNRWQVDWVQYFTNAWGQSWPNGSPVFMLRLEDPSDGVAVQLALSDSGDFKIIDSYNLATTR